MQRSATSAIIRAPTKPIYRRLGDNAFQAVVVGLGITQRGVGAGSPVLQGGEGLPPRGFRLARERTAT